MSRKRCKRYNETIRHRIARNYQTGSRSATEVAEYYGVSRQSLLRWHKMYEEQPTSTPSDITKESHSYKLGGFYDVN